LYNVPGCISPGKTQNADFAGDFAVYVDDYAEWICYQAFNRRGGAYR